MRCQLSQPAVIHIVLRAHAGNQFNMAKIKQRKAVPYGDEFFEAAGVAREVIEFAAAAPIFSQGEPAPSVMYIHKGAVKLSVVSKPARRRSSGCWRLATSSVRGVWRVS